MASYPTSIVSNTDPTSGNTLNNPDHAGLHSSHNAEISAVETKIGTGASTPTVNKLLYGTGTGTSAWTQLTSAQLAASLSDETGSGVAVFGTAPTISAPVVSTGTFASPVLTTPVVITSINDSNGNEVIKTPATASAVNEVTITNAATTTFPSISATGNDSNIDILLIGKGTGSARHAGLYDGWVAANETWTYASATTFTCSAALAAILGTGDRIKLTQTTVKYFYVVSVSGTTITVTGGADYSLANAAITLPFYSHEESPTSFPGQFSYTPTYTNLTVGSGVHQSYFTMRGKTVTANIGFAMGSGSSMGTAPTFTLPITSASTFTGGQNIGGMRYVANSAGYMGYVQWNSTTTGYLLSLGANSVDTTITSTVPNTWGTTGTLYGTITYRAA